MKVVPNFYYNYQFVAVKSEMVVLLYFSSKDILLKIITHIILYFAQLLFETIFIKFSKQRFLSMLSILGGSAFILFELKEKTIF